jgi:2-polyprenyl-6-methoxyphenol hydroxylase-like FAD-dependent oxidoreductase
MADDIHCDVLIAGGGPTGITLGLLLARRGVRVVVADREPDIYPLPRAAHIDHETVRIFQELGLAKEVLASCRAADRYDFLTAKGEVLLRFGGLDRIGPGGWPAANMIHQPSIETTLRCAAGSMASLQLKKRWAWLSCQEREGEVVSRFATPDGETLVHAQYLIGCDGARSPVRTFCDISIDDLHFDEQWLVVDTRVQDYERLPKENLQICDPSRPTTCVLMGSGRHRWEFMLTPGETPERLLDDAFVTKLLEPWNVDGAVTIERKAVYRFNARVAKSWRKGRVFLAGDAAHLMPPFAGQGLCSGLRDAANLAWKLRAVLDGAPASLLDTYQAEREPHARAIISLAIMMGRTVCMTDPGAARARDEQMIEARAAGSSSDGAMSFPAFESGCITKGAPGAGSYFAQPVAGKGIMQRLDDVLGPSAWLIARDGVDEIARHNLTAVALDEAVLAPFRAELAHWLKKHDVDAVLVRPDRYVFGTGDASTLARLWVARTANSRE